jgi:co-chaperonin GroES (HSP10)
MDELRMLGSLLLVSRQTEATHGGGLVLAKAPKPTGLHAIIDVGPKVENLKPGQQVVMEEPGGTEVKVNGQALWVYRADQVLCVCEP